MLLKRGTLLLLLGMACLVYPAHAQDSPKPVQLEDVWKYYRFYARGIDGFTGMNDGKSYAAFNGRGNERTIARYLFSDGEMQEVLFDPNQHQGIQSVDDFSFSPDEEGILLTTQTEPIYRHSSNAMNFIYHRPNNSLHALYDQPVRNATFSPTQDKVAFSHANNLYVKDLKSDKLVAITKDGEKNRIINGTPDWVYEEEFSYHQAYEWSNNGQYIAYVRFDESEVPEFSMDVYGGGLYPEQEVFKYPKAGEVNSKVSLWLYLMGDVAREIKIEREYEYLPRMYWTPNNQLVVLLLNRLQNHLQLLSIDPKSGAQTLLYEARDEAYLELPEVMHFIDDQRFLINSDRDGFDRIYRCDGNNCTPLSIEGRDVTAFYGFDEQKGYLYYQTPGEDAPHQRQVWRTDLKGKSVELSSEKGWNSLTFNPQMTYYILQYERANRPASCTLFDARKRKEVRVMQDNQALKDRLKEYAISYPDFFMAPTQAGHELSAWMIKPRNFDPNKKYPVLCFVYGGPGSQTVSDEYDGFNFMWYQTLADQGYIIASADNRGTGARGRDFKKCTYRELGKLETEDQIAFARYLGGLPYVDDSRIGIWGWSYGGYMSSLCLSKGADVFKAAVAVAPVTNWRFYDNIYTERYMGLPQDNGDGYDLNSPMSHVNKMKGKYLLIHGSGDDNVHVQNSMRMTEALVQADVDFEMFIYPDKNHGIYGGNTRLHLFRKMTAFWLQNL